MPPRTQVLTPDYPACDTEVQEKWELILTVIPNDGGASRFIPNDGGASSVIPNDGGASSVIPNDGGASSVIPNDGGASSVIPNDGGASSVIPNDGGAEEGSLGGSAVTEKRPGGAKRSLSRGYAPPAGWHFGERRTCYRLISTGAAPPGVAPSFLASLRALFAAASSASCTRV